MDNYPGGVKPKDFDEDTNTYTLTIDDVLGKSYVKVKGIEFDTHATAYFTRAGLHGAPELVDLQTRSVSVVVYSDCDGFGVETFRVDESQDWKAWQEDFEGEIEKIALTQAIESFKWELMED